MFRSQQIQIKNEEQVELMRGAGLVVGRTLELLRSAVAPGVSTGELDRIAEESIRSAGAVPSFKGYHGYPGSICASVNEQIVHGIPSAARVLADGDLISVDCGAILDGWHGDAAITIPVGAVSEADLALSAACEEALHAGIAAAQPGARLSDISFAVQSAIAEAAKRNEADYGIVAEYGGHGIGTSMHMDPFLPNHGEPGHGPRLRPGMALAIEPMITAGDPETVELEDGWTVVTATGARAVHWEHSVAITEDGPRVLTLPAS
jgi:methionyl aminopeptidase